MAEASLKLGGSWGVKEGSLLGFNDENGNYKPIPFDFTRATTATRVNRDGLIEEVQSGVPRIDFSNGDGSLLLEPQRTNSLPYSEDFSNAAWAKTNSTITINSAESPEGVNNAAAFIENTSSGEHRIQDGISLTSGIDYTFSVFVKANGRNFIRLRLENSGIGSGQINTWFNISNGTVGTSTAGTNSIVDMGNGWYQCISTGTTNTTSYLAKINVCDADNNASYTGDGSKGVYIYGAQLEQGSYPTSYIKTSGSAVTRNADSYYVDNIGQTTAYTIFIDYNNLEQADTSFQDYISFQASGSVQDGLRAEGVGSEWRLYGYNISGSVTFPIVGSINKKKKAIVISTDGIKLFEDGALTTQDLSGMTIPALGAIVSRRGTSSPYPTEIKQSYNQLMIFPTALTDSECIELTTL